MIFFCLSLFPSIMPRGWLLQGVVSGASIAIGYGLGVLLSLTVRWMFQKELSDKTKRIAWVGYFIVAPILILIFLILGQVWQAQIRSLVQVEDPGRLYIVRIFVLSMLLAILFIKLGRAIGWLGKKIINQLDKVLPRRLSATLAILLTTFFVVWCVSGALVTTLGLVGGAIYRNKNNTTPQGAIQPSAAQRSGSSASHAAWDDIGYEGKIFISGGPTQAQLQDYSGQTPQQPIRLYSGVKSAANAHDRAQIVVDELKRTDAFKRKVLLVVTPTGSGWIEPKSVNSLEYMYNGDTAIVAQQYSYLPSWLSFLVDKQAAQETGRALFDAVHAEWAKLPPENRPKLIAYGLSLGSFGGQAAFSGVNDMMLSTDGALWQGTPGDTVLWQDITKRRDSGSNEWQPTYDDGKTVRFASSSSDITKDQTDWNRSRILYVQHGSDSVTWFNFNLPLQQPDWLRETRAPDVSPYTRWYPFVTFIQIAIDQVFSMDVPADFGHNYGATAVASWAALTAPNNWSQQKTIDLQALINRQ